MKSFTTPKYWAAFAALPLEEAAKAKKQYLLWLADQYHPSVHFKKVGGNLWSARVSDAYRALAIEHDGSFHWFWIGTHREYEKILKGK